MDNFTRDGLTFDVIDSGPSDGDVVLLKSSRDAGLRLLGDALVAQEDRS